MKRYLTVVLVSVFLMANDVEHLFTHSVEHLYISFGEMACLTPLFSPSWVVFFLLLNGVCIIWPSLEEHGTSIGSFV